MSVKKKKEKKSSKYPGKIIRNDGSIDTELLIDLLGNEVDRKIVMKLSKVPRYASDLAIDLGISKPALKKHLDKLERIGLIVHHEGDQKDEKKQFYCLRRGLSLSINLDLSSNYFNYRVENTSLITQKFLDEYRNENQEKYELQVSVYGDKTKKNENSEYYKILANKTAKNESLLQLGRALRNIDLKIREVEHDRNELLAEKNEIIMNIKRVLNTLVEDPMEQELIFSFFYRTLETLRSGISIKKFLEDIFLKFRGTRAGVKIEEGAPDAIKKQMERLEDLEKLLNNLIKEFKFIRTVRDSKTNEQNIFFDF